MSQRRRGVNRFSRRALLGGLGAGAAAPFVPLLSEDVRAAGGLHMRVCFITTPNGVSPEAVPNGGEENFTFKDALSSLSPHKADLSYLHGIDMKTWLTNRIPNDHPPVVNQLLTAADSVNPNDGSDPAVSKSWLSSGQSIDHFLAERLDQDAETRTRFQTINAGVETGAFAWKQVFSSPSNPVFPETNAGNLHSRIFDGVTPGGGVAIPDPESVRRLAERQSVIDSAREELNAVLGRVGADDKAKIEAHLAALRSIEGRLTFDSGPPSASCSIPDPASNAGDNETRYRRNGENMMDVIAHAFACDVTRIATLQWGNGASNQQFPSKGVNLSHHSITHDNYDANYQNRAKVTEWYAERFLYFIEKLKSIPEGDGSVLDNTLLVWTSEHSGFTQHGRENLPFLLAGSLGGTIRTGRFLNFDGGNEKAHNDVYVAIAQALGFSDVTTFGKASVCDGALPGLLV